MKKIVCLVIALCMVFCCAACAGTQQPAVDEGNTPNTPQPAVDEGNASDTPGAPADAKHVEIMFNADETWGDIVENYAKPAMAEHFPDVDIEFVPLQSTSMETLASVGELPDIWFGTCSTALIEAGFVMDMSELLGDWISENFNNPDYYRDSQDRVLAIGSGTDTFYTSVYYYNKDIFNSLNLNEPETFDDLLNICQTLLDNGYNIPISHSGWTTSVYWLEQAIMSYDPEAYLDLTANKTDFNDPRIRAAIANTQKLIDMGALGIGTVEKDATVSISEFVQGDAVIMSTYSWNSGSIAGQTSFEVGQFFLPSANEKYPSGSAYTCWGSFLNGWNVNAGTEDPELVAEILKVLVDCEAKRNFENGLVTNYIVDGDIVFANDLDAERYEMFKNVKTWGCAFYPNTLDSASQSEYFTAITEWLMDDSDLDADGFCDVMQGIWENNTFFDTF